MTSQEIQSALEKPWHAQSISQLITRHESEWFWNAARWDELNELMGHSFDDPNQDWAEEKNRIKTLSWWGDIAGATLSAQMGKLALSTTCPYPHIQHCSACPPHD